MEEKQALRRRLRQTRRAYVAALPASTSALLFKRPPAALATLVPPDACIGLYHAGAAEAPAAAYARHYFEEGHTIALPWFAASDGEMEFRTFADPHGETEMEAGPFGLMQPLAIAKPVTPDVLFIPLLGFTAEGMRLGQGGGHYDRWLAAHPETVAIGLAWDCQRVEELPVEPHDRPLAAIVTPTRLYGPF